MRRTLLSILPLAALAAAPAPPDPMVGTFANEEQVYFEKDAGRTPPAWFALKIARTGDTYAIEEPDVFGAMHDDKPHYAKRVLEGATTILDYGPCKRLYKLDKGALVATGMRGTCRAPGTMTRIDSDGITLTFPDGKTTLLRRSRPVTCWSAVRKDDKTPDGKDDWHFVRDVKIHDQGGRALIGKDTPGVKPVVIRMRNVVWPSGNNRPSLVLYIHAPDEPDRATSYVWADPGAARIGINLRWMQASCTVDGAEKASQVTPNSFRG